MGVGESRRGELTSPPYDPYAGEEEVALDLPPYAAVDGAAALTSVGRRAFVDGLLSRRDGVRDR